MPVDLKNMQSKRVLIIGSGFAGICMAIQLIRSGFNNFQIIEKGDDLGGTWRDNTYPGCACDVPSHFYSFSFEGKADWSRVFPSRDEIFNYISGLGVKYGLYDKTRFNTEIAEAAFDDATDQWKLTTKTGEEIIGDMVVTALGQLNVPKIPDIAGKDNFKGPLFHSARWEHKHDFESKKIAIIGNGPSAAQFIPEIAADAGQLTIFQRSPCHVVPRNDKPYSKIQKFLFKNIPGFRRAYRGLLYWTLESNFALFNENPKQHFLVRLFRSMGKMEDKVHEHITEQVLDPRLRDILTPDYQLGCKRIVISDDYLPALQRDNVVIETNGIERITSTGIATKSGQHHEFDAIIFGTGFEATGFLSPLKITGRLGADLNEEWKDGAEAYLGITVPKFPNFFMLYGPNTNLGHNSIIFMIECQVDYVLTALKEVADQEAATIEIKDEKMTEFKGNLKARLDTSVWAASCDSWYKNEAGKITNNWPDFTYMYKKATRDFAPGDYAFTPNKNEPPTAVAAE
jgi:cation diffusion facilitator CzcD-associated flavoprotein CzcO